MEINLKNIGLIENSTIKLQGLTVLTGENSCGKTTVGKSLYSLIESFYNIDEKYIKAREAYIFNKLDEITAIPFRNHFGYFGRGSRYEMFSFMRKYMDVRRHSGEIDNFFASLKYEIEEYPEHRFVEYLFNDNNDFNDSFESKHNIYLEWKRRALIIWENAYKVLYDKNVFKEYVEDTVNNNLYKIFYQQVKPIKYPRQLAHLTLLNNNEMIVNLKAASGRHFEMFLGSSRLLDNKKCIFIDDPFILDELKNKDQARYNSRRRIIGSNDLNKTDGIAKENRYLLPKDALFELLNADDSNCNYFVNKELGFRLSDVLNKINEVVPGEFLQDSKGSYYVVNKNRLHIANLATGSKMFFIIKMLLLNGQIDENTILILDEPESHLHPEWINKLAEILVILTKSLKVQILLTTHSPNFLMAVEAFSKKHNVQEITHFYHAVRKEDKYRVDYEEITDCTSLAYASFTNPLITVKKLKDE